MTHPVNLEVGMMAIRRDGERVGPIQACPCGCGLVDDGKRLWHKDGTAGSLVNDAIIAAGFPWTELGAQVGDTVRCVWDGDGRECPDSVFVVRPPFKGRLDSLYVIVKRAAKPADRPRAAHRLDLRDGDVVELVKWQDGGAWLVGKHFKLKYATLREPASGTAFQDFMFPKGCRPLFRVISRADAKPDEVIVLSGRAYEDSWDLGPPAYYDTHRFTLTFPHGSDTGTVVREAL